ncbi:MAG: rRNA maturation RNAse YbeY [Polyangiaceae bacterium]|nr:rRNA maturation RNAse YbeY [Polyangiaceae bacterium]
MRHPDGGAAGEGASGPPLDELTTLVAHGLFHLLGFDHRTDAEAG